MTLFLAHFYWCIAGLACITCVALWRWYYYREPRYLFSSLKPSIVNTCRVNSRKRIFFALRTLALVSLVLALGRLQAPDNTTQLPVQGIDIMLLFDVSHSMTNVDDAHDPRSRIQIACDQACTFVDKRLHDAFGLVLFGREVVSRCPCTQDKQLIKELLQESAYNNIIDNRGTMLSKALLCAVNRLKDSRAPSKIIIALTDGEPTQGDIDHRIALELAHKFQIKIYTIGIGSDTPIQIIHPLYGLVELPALNTKLLTKIATSTGGQFFLAKNPRDMKAIYEHIDALEKHEQQVPLFTRYTDYFMPFLVCAFLCSVAEILLASLWWVGL